MDFLFSGKSGFGNIWLNKHGTCLAALVLGKTYQIVGTCVKILIMCLYAFKERCKIVVGITEIIQFNDFLTICRQISFIF